MSENADCGKCVACAHGIALGGVGRNCCHTLHKLAGKAPGPACAACHHDHVDGETLCQLPGNRFISGLRKKLQHRSDAAQLFLGELDDVGRRQRFFHHVATYPGWSQVEIDEAGGVAGCQQRIQRHPRSTVALGERTEIDQPWLDLPAQQVIPQNRAVNEIESLIRHDFEAMPLRCGNHIDMAASVFRITLYKAWANPRARQRHLQKVTEAIETKPRDKLHRNAASRKMTSDIEWRSPRHPAIRINIGQNFAEQQNL